MTTPVKTPRWFVSLGTRLIVPLVLLVAAVAIGTYVGLVQNSRSEAMRSKEAAADMVVKLTAVSVVPAVVFGDELEMKRSVDDLARNGEVTNVELWGFSGATGIDRPLASFRRAGYRTLDRPSNAKAARLLEADSLAAFEPVVGPDGDVVAVLGVRLSTRRESAQLEALSRQILLVSAGTAACLILALLFVIRRVVVTPVKQLQQAARRLAQGGREAEPEAKSARFGLEDEVAQLASAFRDMAGAVHDRETRLELRNAELRLILNSVDQGFFTARADGTLLPERSAIVETWLGSLPEPASFWDIVRRIDADAADWAEAAWSQVTDGVFPIEAAIDQLPKRVSRTGQHFEFAYHPVVHLGQVERVVIVLTDVTASVERERSLAEQHEFSVLVDQFVRDRRAFHDFWNEACALVDGIVGRSEEADGEVTRRNVHTLKGNARFFGLTRVSALCHAIEDGMRERGESTLSAQERESLAVLWDRLRERLQPLMQGTSAFIEVSEQDYERLVGALERRASFETLAELVRGLRREPTAWRLARAGDALVGLCKKLGKTPAQVAVSHGNIRLTPGRFAPFWSVFTHVVNNAADHGIETDEERRRAGKPLPAQVTLSTAIAGDELIVEVSDDGRGIDWKAVEALAKERGLPHEGPRDLKRALLSDGFSLKSTVTDVSGRGVGLAAVRAVVTALGGKIDLESVHGKGTTWRFQLPLGGLVAGGGARSVGSEEHFARSESMDAPPIGVAWALPRRPAAAPRIGKEDP